MERHDYGLRTTTACAQLYPARKNSSASALCSILRTSKKSPVPARRKSGHGRNSAPHPARIYRGNLVDSIETWETSMGPQTPLSFQIVSLSVSREKVKKETKLRPGFGSEFTICSEIRKAYF